MAKRGRPRVLPVLKQDMFGQPLRVNDFVLYSIPDCAKTSLAVGRIVGKNHCYTIVKCLMDDKKHYGLLHNKHGSQLFKIPPHIRRIVTDWDEDGVEIPNNDELELIEELKQEEGDQ